MVATPMRLEDALRFNGYTIDRLEIAAFDVTLDTGVLHIPAMLGSTLTWRRDGETPIDSDSFYLNRLPVFDESYRPVILSHILDRFSTRRLGYSMPGAFALAVRRWGNLNLGPESILNRRYTSSVVPLPLTTIDATVDITGNETTAGTSGRDDTSTVTDSSTVNDTSTTNDTTNTTDKGRVVGSDFPQGILSGNADYASDANDHANEIDGTLTSALTAEQDRTGTTGLTAASNGTTSGTKSDTEHRAELGRSGASVMALLAEQRAAFINADAEFLDAFEDLFLQVWDLPESGQVPQSYGASGFGYGFGSFGW